MLFLFMRLSCPPTIRNSDHFSMLFLILVFSPREFYYRGQKKITIIIIIIINFFPLAFETFGPINQVGSDFLSALGHRLSLISDDPRESSFLFQRLSICIQRFNSVCLCNSFGNLPAQFFDQPRCT